MSNTATATNGASIAASAGSVMVSVRGNVNGADTMAQKSWPAINVTGASGSGSRWEITLWRVGHSEQPVRIADGYGRVRTGLYYMPSFVSTAADGQTALVPYLSVPCTIRVDYRDGDGVLIATASQAIGG